MVLCEMPAFDTLLEQPFAALTAEQRAAALTLGLDEGGWAGLAGRTRAAEDAQTALRQHVPLFRFNALEDELHRLQAQLLEQGEVRTVGGGRSSPGPPGFGQTSGKIPEVACPMCALAYIAEIRSTEEAQDGHFRYEIVLTQRGNEVVVLHKRFSEFVALRQSLTTHLRANTDAGDGASAQAVEDVGGMQQAHTAEPLSRSLSTVESMKPYLDMLRNYPFPSKAPLRAAGGASRLAATRRPVLEDWLNLAIKLARMQPLISFVVLRWLELDDARDLSRQTYQMQHSPTMDAVDGGTPPPRIPPMVL